MSETTDPIHLAIVLDRSGSMASIGEDVIGGYNRFLADQRAVPGRCRVTLAQFDSHDPFEVLADAVSLAEVTDLDVATYVPRGSTPLYDAVGRMLSHVEASRHPDEDVTVLIVTDGQENASSEHTRESVFALIEQKQADGWAFAFLGADQDAYAEGAKMGMAPGQSASWNATKDGTREMFEKLSLSTRVHREKQAMVRRLEADRILSQYDEPMTPFGPLATGNEATPNHRSYWVVPGRLLAGAYPFQADPVAGEERLQGLLDVGVTAFFDLTEAGVAGSSDAHLLEYESTLARLALGADRISRSIADLSIPTVDQAKGILDEIDARLHSGDVVYVHCWGGVGRTGTIIGCWLVRHGLADGVGALELLIRLRNADRGAGRKRSPETDRQREFVRRWEAGR